MVYSVGGEAGIVTNAPKVSDSRWSLANGPMRGGYMCMHFVR